MKRDEHFGQVLRRRRREGELTLQQIADVLKVSVVFISQVERGAKPPLAPATIDALSVILGDVSELHVSADADRKVVQLDLREKSPAHRRVATKLARQWPSMGPRQLRRLEEFFDSGAGEEEDTKR